MTDQSLNSLVAWDAWRELVALSPARIGLGRAGAGVRTEVHLAFQAAHAAARDAVHVAWDPSDFDVFDVVEVRSCAADRQTYLLRPDLGRRLADAAALEARRADWDVVVVVTNGLSTEAVQRHGVGLVQALMRAFAAMGLRVAPVVLVPEGRVALSDDVGRAIGARVVVMVVGERPGLSASDSLGLYLTYVAVEARSDADRNCISNIHPPAGLDYAQGAAKCAWLVEQALLRGYTGVRLKDESPPGLSLGTAAEGNTATLTNASAEEA